MVKVAFHTFGCRANQYDTEMMKARLNQEGIEIVSDETDADVYVINTCAVTRRAENKARQYIRHLAHTQENPLILVTGCYADTSAQEVAEVGGTRVVFGNPGKAQIYEMLQAALRGEQGILASKAKTNLDGEAIETDLEHTRAFVKIQDGCGEFCTFCKTVYARGRPRDKSPEAILNEVRKLVDNGYKEVVFTGINIAQYGEHSNSKLSHILQSVAAIAGLQRIRLSSINLSGVTPDLIVFFAAEPKACPHFHIPLQSGDDTILKQMNRKHTTAQFTQIVEKIRAKIPKVTLGTDLLVGFPGETDEQFVNTCKFVERIGFANVHQFRYSRRPGTAAAFFEDQVPPAVKKRRASQLNRIVHSVSRKIKEEFIGARLQVLIESPRNAQRRPQGYSENYLDVHIETSTPLRRGSLITVKIDAARKDYLIGQPVLPR